MHHKLYKIFQESRRKRSFLTWMTRGDHREKEIGWDRVEDGVHHMMTALQVREALGKKVPRRTRNLKSIVTWILKRPFQNWEEHFMWPHAAKRSRKLAIAHWTNSFPDSRPGVLLMGPAGSANGHPGNHPRVLFMVGTISLFSEPVVSINLAYCSVDNKCCFFRCSEVTCCEMNGRSVTLFRHFGLSSLFFFVSFFFF